MNDTRREFLKSMAPLTAALVLPASARAEIDLNDCQVHADRLAKAMARIHGGVPVILIDHRAAVARVIIT
jgi:hypothetical protein